MAQSTLMHNRSSLSYTELSLSRRSLVSLTLAVLGLSVWGEWEPWFVVGGI